LCETDGRSDNVFTPSKKHREFILNLINDTPVDEENTSDINHRLQLDDNNIDFNDGDNDKNTSDTILSFLENIKQKSLKNTLVKGNRLSPYFLPDLLPDMMRLFQIFLIMDQCSL
jgi:hypothetical protein